MNAPRRAPRIVIYIGPDKCGSTALYSLFQHHPDIAVPAVKDLFFFDRFYHRGLPWYYSQFVGDCPVLADVSHDYIFVPAASRRIAFSDIDYQLVVGLRSPYRRAVSAYRYMWYQGRVRMPFAEALDQIDELLGHGDYGHLLPQWEADHHRSRWRAFDFDAFAYDAFSLQQTFFESLDLSSFGQLPVLELNASRPAMLPAPLMRAARACGWGLRRLGAEATVQFTKNLMQRAPVRRGRPAVVPNASELPSELHARIVDVIERSGGPLRRILGKDPSSVWLEDFCAESDRYQ